MAKPMLVTLPFVLLLLDYWPLGRCPAGPPPAGPGAGAVWSLTQLPVNERLANALVAYVK
jgi:hypothetical protein